MRLTNRAAALGLLLFSHAHPCPALAAEVEIARSAGAAGETLPLWAQLETGENPSDIRVEMQGRIFPAYPAKNRTWRVLLPISPQTPVGPTRLRLLRDRGEQTLPVEVLRRTFPTEHVTLPQGKSRDMGEFERERLRELRAMESPQKLWKGEFASPCSGRISTSYGVNRSYNEESSPERSHEGLDLACGDGAPILAPAAGRVQLVGRESAGFRVAGNIIGIDHGQGVVTTFMHLKKIFVVEGDRVARGQRIALSGNSGASTAPHLHWELWLHGVPVNPDDWVRTPFD